MSDGVDDRLSERIDDRFKAAFEDALARFLADPKSDELLAAIGASAWHRNGSMAFATALADRLGGALVSIGWYALLADHVALACGGSLLDAEGVYSEEELLVKRSRLARAPLGVWPITASTVTPAIGNEHHRAALAALLASYLPELPASPGRKTPAPPGVERRRRPRKAATPQTARPSASKAP